MDDTAMDAVEIRRSSRRKRTVRAYREGGRTIVLMPAHLTAEQERQHVRDLVARLDRREQRAHLSDDDLMRRADQLSAAWLGGRAAPRSVRWVSNQTRRWGSCTSADGTIRLSDRMVGMPTHVVDYVLLHELAHLLEPNHGPRFKALVEQFPDTERAEAFLAGVSWATRRRADG